MRTNLKPRPCDQRILGLVRVLPDHAVERIAYAVSNAVAEDIASNLADADAYLAKCGWTSGARLYLGVSMGRGPGGRDHRIPPRAAKMS